MGELHPVSWNGLGWWVGEGEMGFLATPTLHPMGRLPHRQFW